MAPEDEIVVHRLLGLRKYYEGCFQNFATMSEPLRRLTRKGVRFDWDEECQQSFQAIKDSLSKYLQLHIFDPVYKTYVTTDASDVGI